jgi:TRAP-type uncharacterized transport system fused permease subunit
MTSTPAVPEVVDAAPPTGAPPVEGDGGSPFRWSGFAGRWSALRRTTEAGMSTAEYAVGTVAACAFAAVLYRVVTGSSVVTGLTDLVERALATLS